MYGPKLDADGDPYYADDDDGLFIVTRDTDYPTFNVTEHVRPMFEVLADHSINGCHACWTARRRGELIVVD